jgi:hypothetical protein
MSLIRNSFFIDIFSNAFVLLAPGTLEYSPQSYSHLRTRSYSQSLFVFATSLSSFGSGIVPAMQSLALCILQRRGDVDVGAGRLFGAMAVVQAAGQTILGVCPIFSLSGLS